MWSENLQKQTVEHFKKLPMAAMKQVGGRFGFCIYKNGQYVIKNMSNNQQYIFDTIDDLIAAKWAID